MRGLYGLSILTFIAVSIALAQVNAALEQQLWAFTAHATTGIWHSAGLLFEAGP